MKIKEILTEILWEGQIDGVPYILRIDESGTTGFEPTAGSIIKSVGSKTLKFISNPIVAGLAAGYAIDAIKNYKRNKELIKFKAYDSSERVVYQRTVDELMRTGHYRKEKQEHAEGGYIWVLRRL